MLSGSTHGHLLVFAGVLLLSLFAYASIMGKIIFILLFRPSHYNSNIFTCFSVNSVLKVKYLGGEQSDIVFT